MKIAHFTAGTIGAAHFIHAYAIRRALGRAGFTGDYRLFAPTWRYPFVMAHDWYERIEVVPERQLDIAQAADTSLTRTLRGFRPDLIIAELFWAPLHHIRHLFDCEVWLLLRKCVDQWFVGPPEARYDPARWDRIIAMEPIEHPSITHRIDPVVCANPDECQPDAALREHLGVADEKTLAVVAHTGPREEQDALAAVGEEDVHVAHFDLNDPDSLFPLAEWLPGADVIMTGAGFNAYWESKWLGFYDRCFFTAFPRPIDDQAWRARECADYWPKENGADTLSRWIVST